jgi:trimethylamine--corrinoid protein Co-methyltransferase
VLPFPLTQRLEVLPERTIDRIHEGTLRILDRVGVEVRSGAMIDRLERAGARADRDAGRVRFPREVVEQALALAPSSYVLAGRDPVCDLHIDGTHGHLSVDGNAAEIIDLETGERRPSTKADLAQVSRVADALPQISFLWQAVTARDVPIEVEPLHELHAQLTNTSKHIQLMTAVQPQQARAAVEIARIAAGGERELRERPLLSAFQTSLSPLTYDGPPLEAAAIYAEAGVPCGFVAMPITCATAPATRAGSLVSSNAEVLAGIVALQLLVPGAKTFYGACGTVMDLRSGAATCGGPEDLLYQMASAQLARRYRVPANIGTFATGSKLPDWQAGVENGLSVVASWLGGADMFGGAGLLYGARVYSIVELLLDCELFDLARGLSGGIVVDDEDLALEVIEAVGPAGHFLAEPHTLRNMRRRWHGNLMGTETWEEWEALGRPEPRDRARERARQLLAEHVPMPLPSGAEECILEVIEAHDR